MRSGATLVVAIAIALTGAEAQADLANHELLHKHLDDEFATLDLASLTPEQREELYAPRLSLTLGLLVPVYGTYRLDNRVFGSMRPAGVIFDWIAGGLVPAALGVTALATDGRTRSICGWTALGLYTATRIGTLVFGSLHLRAYNQEVKLRLSAASTHASALAPALVAETHW
ncbi:MAG: hypothetical protein AB7P03_23330 [Kofleriaceae bacterium]